MFTLASAASSRHRLCGCYSTFDCSGLLDVHQEEEISTFLHKLTTHHCAVIISYVIFLHINDSKRTTGMYSRAARRSFRSGLLCWGIWKSWRGEAE